MILNKTDKTDKTNNLNLYFYDLKFKLPTYIKWHGDVLQKESFHLIPKKQISSSKSTGMSESTRNHGKQ